MYTASFWNALATLPLDVDVIRVGFHQRCDARARALARRADTHWHCSPTRRSFLTGRWPIHHGEQLSGDTTDDIDLRMDWVSDKLHAAGYQSHWFGKW